MIVQRVKFASSIHPAMRECWRRNQVRQVQHIPPRRQLPWYIRANWTSIFVVRIGMMHNNGEVSHSYGHWSICLLHSHGYACNWFAFSCEVWCPSGSDDDCPDGQLCFAFSQCHAVDMNATTLKQQEEAQSTASQNGGTTQGNAVGVPAPSTMGPTNKPSLSAEQAMHRYSFCGKYWDDVSGVVILCSFLNYFYRISPNLYFT